ncbi:MAG TPA: glycosyltransferase family 4 protein [Thermoanaerobaculia bacterium]|nr:glycosyltransferase family 4 protein [Thermoanaerobaculia bacterium]
MRIAYVSADPGVPIFGSKGNSVHVQEMVRSFRLMGAEVHIISPAVGGEPSDDLRDLHLHRLPKVPKGDLAERERGLYALNDDLAGILESAPRFDLLYERYSLWSHAALELARRNGIPAVLEVNAPLIDEQAEHRGLSDHAKALSVANRAFAAAKVLVAVSDGVASWLERFEPARGKIHVIPNGVSAERFPAHLSPAAPAGEGIVTVGFLGTLKPWHGLGTLADAFEIVYRAEPRSRLLVVGDGPERSTLAERLSPLGDAVVFTGAVRTDAVAGYLASMEIGVAPYPESASFYFSPLKVYEYMAAGLPVVASRIGQLEQLIDDGVNGFLCTPGDTAAFAETILRLARTPQLRERVGSSARRHVLGSHTWDSVARRVLELAAGQVTA